MCGNKAESWNTYPKRRFSGGRFLRRDEEYMVRPSASISPSSGVTSPAMQLSSVVLPLPDGPNIAVIPASNVASHSRENPWKRLAMLNVINGLFISHKDERFIVPFVVRF